MSIMNIGKDTISYYVKTLSPSFILFEGQRKLTLDAMRIKRYTADIGMTDRFRRDCDGF